MTNHFRFCEGVIKINKKKKKSQNSWNLLEKIVLMKIPLNSKGIILPLLLSEVTAQNNPRDLENPAHKGR